jgi:DNA-binding FrmR family transcriptional regulator
MEYKLKVRKQEEKKQIISRLNRLEGQIKGVKKMIEEDRYCNDVLIQLSAIDKAIKSLANLVLDSHMHTCLIERVNSGDYEAIDEVVDLFKRFQ